MATLQEVLSVTQRIKRAMTFKKNKAKIMIGRERALKKVANKDTLMKRARKHARNLILKKILKNVPKDELSPSRKAEIEKMLDKPSMEAKIQKLAIKILPQIRKLDQERHMSPAEDNSTK